MNHKPNCEVLESTIETIVQIAQQIPEFKDPYPASVYHHRLDGVPHLVLAAKIDGKFAGFKVGYQREDYFYSWMGGVVPEFRRKGVAKALADAQENWAKAKGYTTITFKTRNSNKGMLVFALQNGFDIIGFKARETIETHRILLRKSL